MNNDISNSMPPSLPMKRPSAPKRVLPPVPREMTDVSTTASAIAQPANHATTTASTAAASAVQRSAAPASQPALTPASIYTVPLWSAAPSHEWSLSVIKDGREVESIPLRGASHFLLGRLPDLCDIVLEHESVSRRHAVLQFHTDGSLHLYDLQSAHGTFHNKNQVKAHTFEQIHPGDMLKFGASTRLYVVEGPEEMKPRELDRGVLRKMKEARKQLSAVGDSKSGDNAEEEDQGASWGQDEDAHNEEDENANDDKTALAINDDGTTSIARPSAAAASSSEPPKLTAQQEKWLAKLETKRAKFMNLSNEVETLRSKDIKQGGLTTGQEAQITRNETRMQEVQNEINQLEEMIEESMKRVGEDRERHEKRIGGGKKKRGGDSDDDGDDDSDDDFYDRTKSKPLTSTSSTATAASSNSLVTLTPLSSLPTIPLIEAELKKIEQKRDQLRLTLSEVVVQEARASAKLSTNATDSLDAYMSSISTTTLTSRKQAIQQALQSLQTHYILLQRGIEQRKGEALVERFRAGEKDVFQKQTHVARNEQKESQSEKMEIDSATPSSSIGPSLPASSSASSAVAPTSSATKQPPSTSAASIDANSTAAMLARAKKKASLIASDSTSKREADQTEKLRKIEEMKLVLAEADAKIAASAPTASSSSNTTMTDTDSNAPTDRYSNLARQLESARGAIHRAYDDLPDDEVAIALRASAKRSTNNLSLGLTGQEEKGGLHVRKRTERDEDTTDPSATTINPDGNTASAKRMKLHTVGPVAPMHDPQLEQQQVESSVEWIAPSATASTGQAKLKAKFAGRY